MIDIKPRRGNSLVAAKNINGDVASPGRAAFRWKHNNIVYRARPQRGKILVVIAQSNVYNVKPRWAIFCEVLWLSLLIPLLSAKKS